MTAFYQNVLAEEAQTNREKSQTWYQCQNPQKGRKGWKRHCTDGVIHELNQGSFSVNGQSDTKSKKKRSVGLPALPLVHEEAPPSDLSLSSSSGRLQAQSSPSSTTLRISWDCRRAVTKKISQCLDKFAWIAYYLAPMWSRTPMKKLLSLFCNEAPGNPRKF